MKYSRIFKFIEVLLIILLFQFLLLAQTVEIHNAKAEQYYKQKKFALAITEWIKALEIDPDNTEIQQRIEDVYEKKQEKDLAFEKSKKYLREARKSLEGKEALQSQEQVQTAIEQFIIAYRIDPNDTEMAVMKNRLQRLREEAQIEVERQKLEAAKRKEYDKYYAKAQELMAAEKFEESIVYWDKMLGVFPRDDVATKGKRKANLAIQSRLQFEQIQKLLASGKTLFGEEKYHESQNEFVQVTRLDPGNPEAEQYLAKIEEILEEKEKFERKRIQAERFYISGVNNAAEYRFDDAREDYESVLALIDNYKDAQARLDNLDNLEAEYKERIRKENLEKINREFQNGLLSLTQGDYESAVTSFEAVLAIDPKNTQASRYVKMAKEALAQEREDLVDENSPYYPLVTSLKSSGIGYYKKGEYEKSLKQWEAILNLFPKNIEALEYVLRCQLNLNPEIYKTFSKKQIDEGKEFLKNKNYKRALRKFEMIKSIDPDYEGIDDLIAAATPKEPVLPVFKPEPRENKPQAGEVEKPKASRAKIEASYARGLKLYREGNLKSALAAFRFVASNDPQNMKALININKIESELRYSSGSTTTKAAKKLTPRQKKLIREYYYKGINYYSKNQFPEAITEWRKVLSIDPDHEKAKNNIRKCLLLIQQ